MTTPGGLYARLIGVVGQLRLDVQFDTGPGVLVLVGPNGAGKSSLLACLLGVQRVQAGRLQVGTELLLDTAGDVEVPVERRRLGYLPQDYALFPHLNVRENVEFALCCAAPEKPQAQRALQVDRVLEELGLAALAHRDTRSLSGGEKQRVGLARALSVEPRALLLDEPLAALDVHSRMEVRNFLAAYLSKLGLPTVVVTHDPADARVLGQRVAVLERGTLTQVGTWEELSAAPRSPFVEAFVGSTTAGPSVR